MLLIKSTGPFSPSKVPYFQRERHRERERETFGWNQRVENDGDAAIRAKKKEENAAAGVTEEGILGRRESDH